MLPTLAGMRPANVASDEKAPTGEQQRPAVLLNLFLGGEDRQIRVVDGHVTDTGKPVRLAGEAIRQLGNRVPAIRAGAVSEQGSGGQVVTSEPGSARDAPTRSLAHVTTWL